VSDHSIPDASQSPFPAPAGSVTSPREEPTLPVGDVLVRPDATGYSIFNYRGEPVIDVPLRTSGEAVRLAAEIVAPWHGRVRILDAALGH